MSGDTSVATAPLRLVAVTAPDGVLHVLLAHVDGAVEVAHAALGAAAKDALTLADAFAATRCASDDAFADLVVHLVPLAHSPETRRVECVHLNTPLVRPASFTGPLGERFECIHDGAPAALAGRACVSAATHVPGGPWCVGVEHADSARLDRARAAAGDAPPFAPPFAPYRLVLADDADDGLEVVDARAWCRTHLLAHEVAP